MFMSVASGLTVETFRSSGATSNAARTSSPVGAMSEAPGTEIRSPTDVSMLEPVSSAPS